MRPTQRLWLDALLIIALFMAAVPLRYAHTRGDLWSDEADYALAATHGFAANRLDRSPVASDSDRLVRSRHFHPPMTVYLLTAAQQAGRTDRILRTPFVIAGSLAVCLTYLCGLLLYDGRRDISLFCAVVVLVTPLQIRAASHAIPWSLITLGLLSVLYTLLGYIQTAKPGWLVATCGVMGWLFCTSESFFPIALAIALSLPFVIKSKTSAAHTDASNTNVSETNVLETGAKARRPEDRRALPAWLAVGLLLFVVIVLVLWPAGPLGGAWKNIQHYTHIPETSASARVGEAVRSPIPKWAFLYWFTHDYKPYFVLYALGAATLFVQAIQRKLTRGAGVLLVFAVVEIAVAHAAIQFGPQYLAHCLPLLTLMAGFWFLALSKMAVPASLARYAPGAVLALMGITCLYFARWHVRPELRATDEEAMISRWPDAARFLAARWQPGDRLMIGPQPTVVSKWYLFHNGGTPAMEAQVGELPQGRSRQAGLLRMAKGAIRFAVISSTFENDPDIDPAVRQMLTGWPVVYRSVEPNAAPPRLVIYERP